MIEEIKKDARIRMSKSLASLRTELAKIRTGRAHPSLLEHVQVDYYGSKVPISQAANVSIEDARTLAVAAWDKSMVQTLEKAIMTSDLGLNPVTAGHHHPHSASSFDRRTQSFIGQSCSPRRRKRKNCDPQYPQRCESPPQGIVEGQRYFRGR